MKGAGHLWEKQTGLSSAIKRRVTRWMSGRWREDTGGIFIHRNLLTPPCPRPVPAWRTFRLQISWNAQWKTTGGQTGAGLLSPQQELRGDDGRRSMFRATRSLKLLETENHSEKFTQHQPTRLCPQQHMFVSFPCRQEFVPPTSCFFPLWLMFNALLWRNVVCERPLASSHVFDFYGGGILWYSRGSAVI